MHKGFKVDVGCDKYSRLRAYLTARSKFSSAPSASRIHLLVGKRAYQDSDVTLIENCEAVSKHFYASRSSAQGWVGQKWVVEYHEVFLSRSGQRDTHTLKRDISFSAEYTKTGNAQTILFASPPLK